MQALNSNRGRRAIEGNGPNQSTHQVARQNATPRWRFGPKSNALAPSAVTIEDGGHPPSIKYRDFFLLFLHR